MSNHEDKIILPFVHMLMGLNREKPKKCMRMIDNGAANNVDIFEAKLKILGGTWRIHRTVNARDINKARKWLMIELINHPEKASYMESLWRTALLQKECIFGQKYFMLDIDTENIQELKEIENRIPKDLRIRKFKSPKGWHYIVKPFDTRSVCELDYVALIRDGYYFIKEVIEDDK